MKKFTRAIYVALALIVLGTAVAAAVQISLDSPATLPSDI
jgi:hypothetical protein